MNVYYFVLVLTLASSFSLSGCTETEMEQRIALCKEVMELHVNQLRGSDEQKERYTTGCGVGWRERTLEQWQCALATMRQGELYLKAKDKCFPK